MAGYIALAILAVAVLILSISNVHIVQQSKAYVIRTPGRVLDRLGGGVSI